MSYVVSSGALLTYVGALPAWTNPALAILAILTVSFFGAMPAALFIRIRGRFQG